MSDIKVRFAPSPTGHLHIGGARTALFNWLFARHAGGKFVLRIEDTDRTRSTDEYIESIMEGMTWLGLDWDEGPYRQTNRFPRYKEVVDKLISEGKAYRCWCSAEELEARRQEAMKAGGAMQYDRRCRERAEPSEGVSPVIRFAMPLEGAVSVTDMIKGTVTTGNEQLDDLIIARSDGTPTYNLCVVVDDVDMGITHVIRGDDHLSNTPKQLHIYRAMGAEVPVFAHLPMILGADKKRLSKRHGATSVIEYRKMGYLPHALANYLVRLGWSHGDQEVFTPEELVEHFEFGSVGTSAAVFNPEKLLWLNAEWIKKTPHDELCGMVMPFLIEDGTVTEGSEPDRAWLGRAIATLTERARDLRELAAALKYYIAESVEYDGKAAAKFLTAETKPYLEGVREGLAELAEMEHSAAEAVFNAVCEKHGVKLGKIAQPVRVALTGGTASPGIFEMLEVFGREKALARLDAALAGIG
jgi:glutamyl-tRNA synthetase